MTVDCEQAAKLISARIDRELGADDETVLDAHLAECAACRAASEAAELQDAAMVRAFAARRDAAAELASRVEHQMAHAASNNPRRRCLMRWAGWASAAAAAGVIGGMILMRPAQPPVAQSHWPPAEPAEPIALLALASGEVFTCPSGEKSWQPMAKGAAVTPGAKVRTAGAAKCELALPDGSRLRLNSDTELCLNARGDVELSGGQIFSAVPLHAGPLQIAAGEATVTTASPAAQFDVARAADAATVTVVAGSAHVNRPGQATTVRGGEFLRVAAIPGADPPRFYGCRPVPDPLNATRWLDDLLVLLPPDDPELLARADALLARIVTERSRKGVTEPGPIERHIRARGHAWAAPLARYALDHLSVPAEPTRDKRRTAARLLSDLAPPESVGDLIPLLADEDGEVRLHVATALNRLTGQTLGFPPDRCAATPRDPAPVAAWQQWWTRNRTRYPARL